jgi:hypothetical protein
MFNIGDKVVCVNDSVDLDKMEEIKNDVPNWVQKDIEYTVRGFNENDGIVVGVLLEEIKNPIKYFKLINRFQEPAFAEWRFRKLERKTRSEVLENVDSNVLEEEIIKIK